MTQDSDRPDDVPQAEEVEADKAPTEAPRRKGGVARWISLIVIIVSASVIAAMAPDAAVWFHLQRWSTSGPKRAAEALGRAIEAGDPVALGEVMLNSAQITSNDDGSVALRTDTSASASTIPIDRLRLGPLANGTKPEYITVSKPPHVRLEVPLAEEDGEVTLYLVRDGGWKVDRLTLRGGVMKEIKGPLSPGAQKKSRDEEKPKPEDSAPPSDQPSSEKASAAE